MKKIYTFLAALCLTGSLCAQTLVLQVDAEAPIVSDKTTKHTVKVHGTPIDSGIFINFPNANDYLVIDTVTDEFNINGEWKIECKFRIADSTDEICLIDFRSTSVTGNMYLYYNNAGHGLHFGDRAINGNLGYLVKDSALLPPRTWITVELTKQNGRFILKRDNVVVGDSAVPITPLSEVLKTTIAYSEDRRVAHDGLDIEYLKLTSISVISHLAEPVVESPVLLFPNPVNNTSTIKVLSQEPLKRITLINTNGALIREQSNAEMFIGDLPTGIYFARIELANGRQLVKKIIK